MKFYEFIDKVKKEEEDRLAKQEEEISKYMKSILHKYDVNQDGKLSYAETIKILQDWLTSAGYFFDVALMSEDFFKTFDEDNSGFISKFELKNLAKTFMTL